MQELRLVAVSEDGTYLVLATAGRGTRFTLPVDDRLRAAVRGHFSRLGQFEIEVESPLRPKEIQARIRSGETAEEIAESAGIPVERIRWFEGPVLQEREYMAQQAQRVAVRRPGESTPGPPLGETVEERLGRGGVDLDEAEWDSWKCEDNTWRVRLSFFDNGRPHAAEWVFDPRRRHVSPLDEIAARLTAVEWDEESLSDTVTPLVPRRPAMKVVSGDRGLPAEPEQPAGPEPLRAAEPREYVIERGRALDSRSSFPPAAEQAPTPLREAGARRVPPAEPEEHPVAEAREPAESLEDALARGAAQLREAAAASSRDDEAADLGEVAADHRPSVDGGETDDVPGVTDLREDAEEEHATAGSAADGQEAAPEPEAAPGEATHAAEDAEEEKQEEAAEAVTAEEDAEAPPAEPEAPPAGAEHDEESVPAEKPEPPEAEESVEAAVQDEAEEAVEEKAPEPAPAEDTEDTEDTETADRPGKPDEAADKPDDADLSPAARKAAQRPAHRAPAKKKPAGRPAVPPAQDKPAAASETPAAAARAARGRRKAKGKRASVPSWDEIMFGARRPE
ncbi:septation protein SepH [Actinomadura litoris]|uniref:septation protein SepH n=1 Tax=Actinomadura litoris TaxID=2678616 RepID=UPI001FA6F2F0|nr:septation protein SepH [Actinomadura litoris]